MARIDLVAVAARCAANASAPARIKRMPARYNCPACDAGWIEVSNDVVEESDPTIDPDGLCPNVTHGMNPADVP